MQKKINRMWNKLFQEKRLKNYSIWNRIVSKRAKMGVEVLHLRIENKSL